MRPNKMKTQMIRSAVEKGVRDIRDDSRRGIRNLVELGEMFAASEFQREFFETILLQLREESSAYYRIVEQAVRQFDTDAFTSFGINLGYNALSHGASIIRRVEANEGFNVPWCLNFEVGDNSMLTFSDIERLVGEGKELGIYCHLFHVETGYSNMDGLVQMLGTDKECAFALFCDGATLDDSICDEIQTFRHITILLDIDETYDDHLTRSVHRLQATGNICGGFSRTAHPPVEVTSMALLTMPEMLGLSVMIYAHTNKHHPLGTDDVFKQIVALREHLEVPVLLIDINGDIAHADRIISGEACLASVTKDGTLILTNVDQEGQVTAYDVREKTLREAFSSAPRKTP